MKKLFDKFLKKHRAYQKFYKNLNDFNEKIFVNEYFNNFRQTEYISSAFDWRKTSQNNDFWLILEHKWINELLNLKIRR